MRIVADGNYHQQRYQVSSGGDQLRMSPSIFLMAATRAKLPKRTSAASISIRDACFFIETFLNGGRRCYATHSATSTPEHSNQPQSHRPFDARRTLLHRTYISLLRSTPLLVLFQ